MLLSAGVGVTPMVSMLGALLKSERVIVHVAYSRPEPGDVRGRDYDSEGRADARCWTSCCQICRPTSTCAAHPLSWARCWAYSLNRACRTSASTPRPSAPLRGRDDAGTIQTLRVRRPWLEGLMIAPREFFRQIRDAVAGLHSSPSTIH